MRLIDRSIAILALASVSLLPGCAASAPAEPEKPAPIATVSAEPADDVAAESGDVVAACEAFNALAERLRTADETVDDIFIDIYEDADAAAAVAPEDLHGALTALSLIALDRDGGEVPQEDHDLVVNQWLHITPICAEQGVEIVL